MTREELLEENLKLRAEIEALKPKPVVKLYYGRIVESACPVGRINYSAHDSESDTLLLEFHDGVLVSAKVKPPNGEWG